MSSAAYEIVKSKNKKLLFWITVSKTNEGKKQKQNLQMGFKWFVTKHKHTYAQSTSKDF